VCVVRGGGLACPHCVSACPRDTRFVSTPRSFKMMPYTHSPLPPVTLRPSRGGGGSGGFLLFPVPRPGPQVVSGCVTGDIVCSFPPYPYPDVSVYPSAPPTPQRQFWIPPSPSGRPRRDDYLHPPSFYTSVQFSCAVPNTHRKRATTKGQSLPPLFMSMRTPPPCIINSKCAVMSSILHRRGRSEYDPKKL